MHGLPYNLIYRLGNNAKAKNKGVRNMKHLLNCPLNELNLAYVWGQISKEQRDIGAERLKREEEKQNERGLNDIIASRLARGLAI